MRFRGKSIRRKIVGLLLVPLVSLTAIWAFATVLTGRDALGLLDVAQVVNKVGYPTEDAVQTLQQERRQTLVYLADPRRSDGLVKLHKIERSTDKVLERLRRNVDAEGLSATARSGSGPQLAALLEAIDGLDILRAKVEEGTITRNGAFAAYNEIVDPCYDFLSALHAGDDVKLDREGHALVGITRAREALSREDALLSSALAAGHMTAEDLRNFSDRIAERKLLYATNLPVLPDDESAAFERYWNGTATAELRSEEQRIIDAGPDGAADAVNAERWHSAVSTVLDELDRKGIQAGDRYQERLEPVAVGILVRVGAAGVLGFVALVLSLVLSFRIGRGLIRDLTRLRKEANEAAGVRLPSVLRRLAAGEEVDIETEAPRLSYGQDEIGQVGQALNTLQRAAVEAAVKQAEVRRGVSEVFVNIARRSQVLLHRQLTLLDTMERRTEDADELADLFRLDHMTTRMRRHAEGLVILSGAAPSRQWRRPVKLMDVVRAAVAEVEDYERIEVRRLPRIAVVGPAVGDLTHLLAELLENATVFSPPHTAVQVLGERVANGFTLEIHDRGLGMAPEALLDANLRLAETPEFEPSDTDRLGLFVVSRLARRQGVRVSLQTSPYGGTTAVVFIPAALLTDSKADGTDEETGEQELPGATFPALARSPIPLAGTSRAEILDGPVELEAPLGTLDEEDEEGIIFRRRRRTVPATERATTGEQHQQARDAEGDDGVEPARPDGLAPLPRRRSVLTFDHGRPVQAADGGDADEPSEAKERPEPVTTTPHTTGGGLPRRVRQASLAPQLKSEPGPPPGQDGTTTDPEAQRDAELVRSRMASLQRGWQRGRADTGEDTGPAGDRAPRTPSEGNGR